MALVVSTLTQGLKAALQQGSYEAFSAANLQSEAYNTYAQTVQAGVALPVFTGSEKLLLRDALFNAYKNPNTGSAQAVGLAWYQGLQSFWGVPPVVFSAGADTGVPVEGPTVAALVLSMGTVLSNLSNTVDSAASSMASCLDAATRGFIVTLAPSGTVVPLS